MGRREQTEDYFGKRVKDEREHRHWSQSHMAKLLSDNGIPKMHPTTIAKIEAGDRAVRIDEAAGIADLFVVSLDSLLGRRAGLEEDELTYRLRALRDTAAKHLMEVGVIANAVSDRLTDVLQLEFEGREDIEATGKRADDALGAAQTALWKISSYELPPDSRPRVRDDLVERAADEKLGRLFNALDVLRRETREVADDAES
jgi:transcriptional regulator with XRE-family HTH domain